VTLSVFVLCSAINYLDRQTLATVAPLVRAEFHLSNAQYGVILTVFSIAYACSAPLAGMLIDRIGLHRAISLAWAFGRSPASPRDLLADWEGCWGVVPSWACRRRPASPEQGKPFISTCGRPSAL
jgi:MFS family permease